MNYNNGVVTNFRIGTGLETNKRQDLKAAMEALVEYLEAFSTELMEAVDTLTEARRLNTKILKFISGFKQRITRFAPLGIRNPAFICIII
jgi:hypothetical protein